jgi:hypothetical protein
MMYSEPVKRLQISIDEDLDDALGIEASRRRTSKAALIRQYVRERLGTSRPPQDPMTKLIGDIDDEAGDIDAIVYDK